MERVIKLINAVAPFLAVYPVWVRGVFCLWIFVSAILLTSLVLAKRTSTPENTANMESPESSPYLVIGPIEKYGDLPGERYRVIATVNGTEFTYPSGTSAKWLEIGPQMSRQRFKVPRSSNGYDISFRMIAAGDPEIEFVSQWTEHVDSIPFRGSYSLHELGQGETRGPGVGAAIEYVIAR